MARSNRLFIVLCLASAVTLAVYIHWSRRRDVGNAAVKSAAQLIEAPASPTAGSTTGGMPPPAAGEARETKAGGEPAAPLSKTADSGIAQNIMTKQVFFRYNGLDNHYGKLAFVPYERPDQPQFIDTLSCEVAHIAGGRGICLAANR